MFTAIPRPMPLRDCDDRHRGCLAATRVQTPRGWRQADTLKPGDRVVTRDGGPRPIRHIETRRYGGAFGPGGVAPIRVARGAFHPGPAVWALPDQPILVDHPALGDVLGEVAALVPARAFDGVAGCRAIRRAVRYEVVTLAFEEDAVVPAEQGLMVHFAAGADNSGPYPRLTLAQSRALLQVMAEGDPWPQSHPPDA